MKQIILRIRPAEVMDDLDIEVIQTRVALLTGWEVEVRDTRLSDAPYITVIVNPRTIDPEMAAQLKSAFAGLPRMCARVWRRSSSEVPLALADCDLLEKAAESVC